MTNRIRHIFLYFAVRRGGERIALGNIIGIGIVFLFSITQEYSV